MASVDDYLMLQYLMVFAVSIFFSALAMERGSKFLTIIVASGAWLITALESFIYVPTVFGSVAGYSFGAIAGLFFAGFIFEFISRMGDERAKRFEVGVY